MGEKLQLMNFIGNPKLFYWLDKPIKRFERNQEISDICKMKPQSDCFQKPFQMLLLWLFLACSSNQILLRKLLLHFSLFSVSLIKFVFLTEIYVCFVFTILYTTYNNWNTPSWTDFPTYKVSTYRHSISGIHWEIQSPKFWNIEIFHNSNDTPQCFIYANSILWYFQPVLHKVLYQTNSTTKIY